MATQPNRTQRRAAAKKAPAKKASARKAPAKKAPAAAAIADLPHPGINESRAREITVTVAEKEVPITVVPFTFRGDEYWFPQDVMKWSLQVMRAFEDDKVLTALELLLVDDEDGTSGYELLMSRGYLIEDCEELFAAIGEYGGFVEA